MMRALIQEDLQDLDFVGNALMLDMNVGDEREEQNLLEARWERRGLASKSQCRRPRCSST